jgi:rhodanese-related sulfurtransferase
VLAYEPPHRVVISWDINPHWQIETNLDKLPQDKDTKIMLYCRSGSMSASAARTLVDQGYTNVWNLDGGMIAWEQAGYSLVELER